MIPSIGVAIDPKTSGRIIDAFKEQQKEILFESLPFSESGANMILEHEYTMNGLDGLRSRLLLIQGAYVEKKNEVTGQRKTLEEALAILDSTIAQTEAQITLSNMRIREKDIKAQELSQLSIDLSKKIYASRKTILSYVANIYAE